MFFFITNKYDKYNYNYDNNDWISIIDFMQSFEAIYDEAKVDEIFESPKKLFSGRLLNHYEARNHHHIRCVFDGIIKTRCLLENDMTFVANDKDYEKLKMVWGTIIKSWINVQHIMNLPTDKRIYYLPVNAQYLYFALCEQRKVMTRQDILDLTKDNLHHSEVYEAIAILINCELVFDLGESQFKPFWLSKEIDNEEIKK
jgi:hypothetical protein